MDENKKSLRDMYIDYILEHKYNDDDPKRYNDNVQYLESLDIEELEELGDYYYN